MGATRRERVQALERDNLAIKMRVERKTYQAIADALGYGSGDAARMAIDRRLRERAKQLAESADTLLADALAEIDVLAVEAYRQLGLNHVMVSNGQVVPGVVDESVKLDAIDRLTRLLEKRTKLLGLDKVIVQANHSITIEGIGEGEMP